MNFLNHYVIDWTKIQTLDDMKRLIAAMEITFSEDNTNVTAIKDLVKLEANNSLFTTLYRSPDTVIKETE